LQYGSKQGGGVIKVMFSRGTLLKLSLVSCLFFSACKGGEETGGGAPPAGGGGTVVDPPPAGGGDDNDNDPDPILSLDDRLAQVIVAKGLTGDPAALRQLSPVVPDAVGAPLEKLGQLLFFSRTLGGDFDVACATCHHPQFAGGDALSLSVGVTALHPSLIGPGRTIDSGRDQDPQRDGGPNIPRNSQSVFNVGLYDRALLHDGRVFVFDEEHISGGRGQAIRTPDSGQVADIDAGGGLLEAQARQPLVSNREMRNFRFPEFSDPEDYRQHLVARLRGSVEREKLPHPDAPERWLGLFRQAFDRDASASADDLITTTNIQGALAAYQRSLVFVDTPWRDYVRGDASALGDAAKRGALLFLKDPDQGGLGCHSCHAGDHFTDEQFHNVGFPQIGRGRRADGTDPGRWGVSQLASDRNAFRTPSLLNVALTWPYGHAGTFERLDQVLRYHADPRREVEAFFSARALSSLSQFGYLDVDSLYPGAQQYTRDSLAMQSFAAAESRLPGRALSDGEVADLSAFMHALSDRCMLWFGCTAQWVPAAAEDPDGNLLVLGADFVPPEPDPQPAYPSEIRLDFPEVTPRTTFPELAESCANAHMIGQPGNLGHGFLRRGYYPLDGIFGLTAKHGWSTSTWFGGARGSHEMAMFAGGVTATWLDDGCWPSLVFAGGDTSGVVLYRGKGSRLGFEKVADGFVTPPGTRFTGAAHADLNGNYRRELLLGNHLAGEVPIYSPRQDGRYQRVAGLPMSRGTFGIALGDIDNDGFPDFYLAHWAMNGVPGTAPALWKNDAGQRLLPYDEAAGTSSRYVDQTFNFTPLFADLSGDGRQDLLIASDFQTSQVLRNRHGEGSRVYENVTDRAVITDENGMGSVVADFFNDGRLHWFVGSIFDSTGEPRGNWGITGNRLYRNTGAAGQIVFEDVTAQAGELADGNWGWGVCAADFNHNGFLDIFMVGGFGYIPQSVIQTDGQAEIRDRFRFMTDHEFRHVPPRLYMNNGDGTFTERAMEWGLFYPSEGSGVACFDYDRDGDIDIVLVDQSRGLQFFENQIGHDSNSRFLGVRLVGAAPNTDALGARVYVTADVGAAHGTQQMLRVSQANSNFNGQNLPDLHFGLGKASAVERLRVVWPDGEVLECENVMINRFVVIDQRQSDGACPQ
jgi:enediyne biosynthesis protein E4